MMLWKIKGRPIPPPHVVKQEAVKDYARRFNVKILIETGTFMGVGEMIDAVLNTFGEIISIEFDPTVAQRAQKKFLQILMLEFYKEIAESSAGYRGQDKQVLPLLA